MKFITEDEPDLTLPEDAIVRARLDEIKLDTFQFTDSKTGERKEVENLIWWWEVTYTSLGDQYIGRRVKGKCSPKPSNRDGNRFREWAEALLQREIPVGMVIDTDDLIGLEAEIVIGHQPDRKDPSKVWEFVSGVAPLSGGVASQDENPPF